MAFRILSLDGGGVRGAYSAAVLASIEELTNKSVVRHFDLIAGTSTGGIIALGLGLGLSAQQILEFYEQRGPRIFPSTGIGQRLWHRVRRVVTSKHDGHELEAALNEIFRDRLLGESSCRLVIPSYDAVTADVHVFKTAHNERVLEDHNRRAAEVARATSAAPTYLPLFMSSRGQRFLDGGLWANSPVVVAILEAVSVLNIPLDDIDVLSIGTTAPAFSIESRAIGGGLAQYRWGIIDLLMRAQASGAAAQATLLTKRRVMRIDCVVKPGQFSIDDARGVPSLVGYGRKEGRHRAAEIADRFLREPAAPFVPIRPVTSVPQSSLHDMPTA